MAIASQNEISADLCGNLWPKMCTSLQLDLHFHVFPLEECRRATSAYEESEIYVQPVLVYRGTGGDSVEGPDDDSKLAVHDSYNVSCIL